jgi:hypothetical protein
MRRGKARMPAVQAGLRRGGYQEYIKDILFGSARKTDSLLISRVLPNSFPVILRDELRGWEQKKLVSLGSMK